MMLFICLVIYIRLVTVLLAVLNQAPIRQPFMFIFTKFLLGMFNKLLTWSLLSRADGNIYWTLIDVWIADVVDTYLCFRSRSTKTSIVKLNIFFIIICFTAVLSSIIFLINNYVHNIHDSNNVETCIKSRLEAKFSEW